VRVCIFASKKGLKIVLKLLLKIVFIMIGVVICMPVFFVVTGSVMGAEDLTKYLAPVYEQGQGFVGWAVVPNYATIEHYTKLLFQTPQFFVLFWNSIKIVAIILAGQLIVGVPAAWAFAVYRGYGKNLIFTLYVVLMLMPFQVMMLSSYIILNKLSLLNTQWAVILPAIFNTFPIILTYGGFKSIPISALEAARIDGAGEFYIFLKIGIPLGKSGVMSAVVLGFLEYWNMVEQPLAFIEDKSLWTLSLYLPEISWTQAGEAFSAAVFMIVPAVFVFLMGEDYVEKGIVYSGVKV
jgi:multiple sugar transport system permease protein